MGNFEFNYWAMLEPMKYYDKIDDTALSANLLAKKYAMIENHNDEYIASQKWDGEWTMFIKDGDNILIRSRSLSKEHDDMEELPDAYEEAQSALKHSWFEKSEKLNFYSDDMKNEIAPVISYDSKQKLVKESMEYIERHYHEPMSVGDIAKALGTSISYLSRIFKENTGETIIRTINNKRIEKAKAYLKETDYKVYEVADILGFENVTYFLRFFKKHTGMSPKEYKDQKSDRK